MVKAKAQLTLSHFLSKFLWFLLLGLPLNAQRNISVAQIPYWHLCLPAVSVCVFACVCLNCSEDIQFECFSFNALSGWGTVVFLSMGLMDWNIQHPSPQSHTHTCKHWTKVDLGCFFFSLFNLFIFLWRKVVKMRFPPLSAYSRHNLVDWLLLVSLLVSIRENSSIGTNVFCT